jgi:PKD repeat protein
LNSPGVNGHGNTLAYGDFLYLNDTTWTPGSVGEGINKWKWTLTPSDPVYPPIIIEKVYGIDSDQNASFGPFPITNDVTDTYILNLTVTDDTYSVDYSPDDMVYLVSDHREFLSVDYEAVPAYNDRTQNPNGTITFRDLSYSVLDPAIYSTEWWWKWTNINTGVSKTLSGVDHFTEIMTDTDFMVNLTVNNSQGNMVSVTGFTKIPPDDVYPIANFSVIPMSGVAPLEIGITDQALSMVNYTVSDVPLSYNYTVWNETGENVFGKEFTTKNVNVTLPDPGTYLIIQNVTNSFGVSGEYTISDIVVSLPDGPIANFSASVREGLAPLNVTLIDQSTGVKPFTYKWEIGNSTWTSQSKTDDNPQFNLTYSGKYWVNLTITDKNGRHGFLNKTDYITVGRQKYPIAAFTAVPNKGPYPLKVSFIDQSVINPDLFSSSGEKGEYLWDFGDGNQSTSKNPTHVYYEPKEYTVRLFVTNMGNMVWSDPKMINVTTDSEYPDLTLNASFISVPQFGNPPLTVTFVDTSRKNEPVTYEWDFDDGSPIETIPNVTHVFGTPRLVPIQNQHYNVTLKIVGLDSGRTSEYRQLITVQPFNADFSEEVVSGTKMRFTDNSSGFPTQWFWLFGDGFTSRDQNPEHDYLSSGTYSVTLHAWNELRKDLKTKEIVVP